MSILSPTSCGFARIAAFRLFTDVKPPRKSGENLKNHKSRQIEDQFNEWKELFIGYNENFNVDKIFLEN